MHPPRIKQSRSLKSSRYWLMLTISSWSLQPQGKGKEVKNIPHPQDKAERSQEQTVFRKFNSLFYRHNHRQEKEKKNPWHCPNNCTFFSSSVGARGGYSFIDPHKGVGWEAARGWEGLRGLLGWIRPAITSSGTPRRAQNLTRLNG